MSGSALAVREFFYVSRRSDCSRGTLIPDCRKAQFLTASHTAHQGSARLAPAFFPPVQPVLPVLRCPGGELPGWNGGVIARSFRYQESGENTDMEKECAVEHEMRGFLGVREGLQKTFTLGEALAWSGVLLTLALLAAHYFRAGNIAAVMGVGGVILFHCSGKAWKTCVVGITLAWGVLEWGMTAQALVMLRTHMGAPWLRGVMILGAVAAVTALAAAYTLETATRKRRETPGDSVPTRSAAFVMTFLVLYAMRSGMPGFLLLERIFPVWGGAQIFLMAWYAGYIAGKLNNPRTSRKMRRTAWALFTFVFFGQLALGFSGVPGPALTGTSHVPVPAFILFAPAYRGAFSMMPFLVAGATLLAGSAWCGMLCYFGPFDAIAASRKPVRPAPLWLLRAIRYGRAVVLLLGIATALVLRYAGAPLETAFGFTAFFIAVSLAVMLFVSRKYTGMAHCTALCPIGFVVNLLGRLSVWRIRIDTERCTGCGVCEKVCAYRALGEHDRERGRAGFTCSMCRDCIGTCSRQAISMRNFILPARVSGHVFTVIVVTLHVVFLAAARPM